MFSFTELFLIYLIIPKIVNGIHVEISGTVYCKFHLGDTSVKARLQGAKVELLERETLFKEGVFAEGLTDENGIFKIEGDPTDGNLLATVRPHLHVYHQCYTPSSDKKIEKVSCLREFKLPLSIN
uniref:Transthyretin-like family protein n=1 Tax=Meloidogyne incognita TaxID=6306 RepID=A0A914L744_MELIC